MQRYATKPAPDVPKWSALLVEAVNKPGLIMEAVPGLGVVPFWVLVVAAIAVWGQVRPGNP